MKNLSQKLWVRISLIVLSLALTVSGLWYRSHTLHNSRIERAVADLQTVAEVYSVESPPSSLGPFGSLLINPFTNGSPSGLTRYGVALQVNEIDDSTIEKLIAIERLDRIVLMSNRQSDTSRRAKPSLDELSDFQLPASREAVQRLMQRYPDLTLEVDPLLELEAD